MTEQNIDPQTPEQDVIPAEMVEAVQDELHRDPAFINLIQEAIDAENGEAVHELVDELHAADVADIFETLSSSYRGNLLEILGDTLDPEILAELEGVAQDEIYESLSNDQIANAVSEMDTDDAVYVLEELDEKDQLEVLDSLAPDDRAAIEESLSYPEDSAGRLMQRDLIALPDFWTIGQAIDHMRDDTEDHPLDFYNIFVVDPAFKPIGTVPLSKLICSKRTLKLSEVMEEDPHVISVMKDQEDVAYQFSKYHLISTAVVNDFGRLVGMITVDDVVDVIEEEAEEDIMALAGVYEGSINETIFDITRMRFTWLFVNLLTAVLASTVIFYFGATIEQMVALAVLMPIVASMGGNAGTQTMTVAVRAIATKELNSSNWWRILNREMLVAFVNGTLLASISGVVAWLWFDDAILGSVFAFAMVVNLIVAGFFGLMIPVMLDKMDIDPAISSSVFVTTITDVIGFFAFLGVAAAVLF